MNRKALINHFNKYGLQLTEQETINDEYFGKIRFMYFDNDNIKIGVEYSNKNKEYRLTYLLNNTWYIGFGNVYNMWDFKFKFKFLLMKLDYRNLI